MGKVCNLALRSPSEHSDTEDNIWRESFVHVPTGILEIYREAFRQHGRNEKALLWGKNKQAVRFASLCKSIPNASATLLDYGCGLGNLADWLSIHRPAIFYTGVDALPEFIASNKIAFPSYSFFLTATPDDVPCAFDHVVCSGVFNLDPDNDPSRHWQYVQKMLSSLFTKARVSLHVDFLAHDTDFRKPLAYHQSVDSLLEFTARYLSKRYLLDRTYMPYEFSISIFADDRSNADQNIYRPLDADGLK